MRAGNWPAGHGPFVGPSSLAPPVASSAASRAEISNDPPDSTDDGSSDDEPTDGSSSPALQAAIASAATTSRPLRMSPPFDEPQMTQKRTKVKSVTAGRREPDIFVTIP